MNAPHTPFEVQLPPGLNFVGGEWVDEPGAERLAVVDPATEQVLGDIPNSGAASVERAVQAARAAFRSPAWRALPPLSRERLLHRLADLVEQSAAELAAIEAQDNGKPITFASTVDVPMAVNWLRYMAGWPSKLSGQSISPALQPGGSHHAYTVRQAVGVVAAIVPWNYPLLLAVWKLAPALAAGCTVVLKPAEATPYSALRLAQLVQEAGFPPGVVNVVLGDGRTGQALVDHPDVDKVSFTGSTATGKRLVASVAGNLKRLTLELGGKSPSIILPDADLASAIPGAAQSVFFNTGQTCFAGTRLFAPRRLMDQVLEGVGQVAAAFKVGPGLDPTSMLGPVVNQRQLDSVLARIRAGVDAGAEVVTGGARVERCGFFVEPTILLTSDPKNPAYREEVFGPVITATPYDDLDELAALANDSEYGLAANVYTRDLATAHRLALAIDAGTVWVNTQLSPDPAVPFGGFKQSGWGRENGAAVFEHYTETKSVIVKLA